VEEQVAVIYAGINGYLDEIPVNQITKFVAGLRDYLKTSKANYVEAVRSSKQLAEDTETLLKEALTEYKQTFLVAQ
ncbi:MAG TPA: F0F1 ATP synthase subunit alpha, partial [Coleofasciculaceae cyanobacterium]